MFDNGSLYNHTSDVWTYALFNVSRYLVATFYSMIFVLGIVGNMAACHIIYRRPKRTATSIFLINLSLADLMMAFFCVPLTLISDCLLLRWVFGRAMCHVFPFIQGMSVFLSALTHVAVSMDRYFVVFHPLRRQNFPLQGAVIVVVFVWVFSVLVSTPMAYVSVMIEGQDGQFCREMWNDERHAVIYSIVVMVLQYFLPLVVIVCIYTVISLHIWSHRPPGESIRDRDEAIIISKRKMIKMFILVAVFYSLSQLPRHIMYLTSLRYESKVFWNEYTIWVVNFTHLLSMSACFYNPLLYIWLNASFRRKFRCLFHCKSFGSQQSNPDHMCTFQDNPMLTRRMLSSSFNNIVRSPKSSDRRS